MAPAISAPHPVFFKWGGDSLKREKEWDSDQEGAAQELILAPFLLLFRLLNSFWVPAGPRLYWMFGPRLIVQCPIAIPRFRRPQALSVAVVNVHYGCHPFPLRKLHLESPPLVLLSHFWFEATAPQQLHIQLMHSVIQYLKQHGGVSKAFDTRRMPRWLKPFTHIHTKINK